MPSVSDVTRARACAKIILLGEHAVVYGRPAIAVPVSDRRVHVDVTDAPLGSGVEIEACDLDSCYSLGVPCVDEHGPFIQAVVEGALREVCGTKEWPDLVITVRSRIPIARGMGSGAAVSAAITRAIADHLGFTLPCERLSQLVFDTECLLHGTPSGIDNTVVAFEMPVWFRQGEGAETFDVGTAFDLLIGDTGIPSRTGEAVAMVHRRWERSPKATSGLFDGIAATVRSARGAIAEGDLQTLGMLMDRNQAYLQTLGVSSAALDDLVAAARGAGALGAKLSGGGLGGCMIALADSERVQSICEALYGAGAEQVLETRVGATGKLSGSGIAGP